MSEPIRKISDDLESLMNNQGIKKNHRNRIKELRNVLAENYNGDKKGYNKFFDEEWRKIKWRRVKAEAGLGFIIGNQTPEVQEAVGKFLGIPAYKLSLWNIVTGPFLGYPIVYLTEQVLGFFGSYFGDLFDLNGLKEFGGLATGKGGLFFEAIYWGYLTDRFWWAAVEKEPTGGIGFRSQIPQFTLYLARRKWKPEYKVFMETKMNELIEVYQKKNIFASIFKANKIIYDYFRGKISQ